VVRKNKQKCLHNFILERCPVTLVPYACLHVCVYIYIYIHTHTHTRHGTIKHTQKCIAASMTV